MELSGINITMTRWKRWNEYMGGGGDVVEVAMRVEEVEQISGVCVCGGGGGGVNTTKLRWWT